MPTPTPEPPFQRLPDQVAEAVIARLRESGYLEPARPAKPTALVLDLVMTLLRRWIRPSR